MTQMQFLESYCQEYPELYNKVSNLLWINFGLSSAEITHVCTFITHEIMTKEKNEDKNDDESGS